jgi:GTP pyrophosphokinase
MSLVIRKYIASVLKEQKGLDPVQATAQYAHKGQKRRTGEPYIIHPSRVADIVSSYYPSNEVAYFSALLHDSLEDAIEQGNVSDEDEMIALIHDAIEDIDLANKVVDTVVSLTKPKSANYSDYLLFLSNEPDALIVKMADMLDNISDNPSERQKNKYSQALKDLQKSFGGKPNSIHQDHWELLLNATE